MNRVGESEQRRRSSEFPWAVPVCALKHPQTGELLPGMLPTQAGGLLVSYADAHEGMASALVESAVLSLLDELPFELADVHVIDFGIRKRFHHLSALEKHKLYAIYHRHSDAATYLAEVERVSIHRHHRLLDGSCATLSDYNRANRVAEGYSVIVVNLDDYFTDGRQASSLARPLQDCFAAGFYPVFLNRLSAGEDEAAKQKQAFLASLRNSCPEVRLGGAAEHAEQAFGADVVNAPGLQELCARFDLSLEPREVAAEALLESLLSRAASEDDTEQDFLSVPVGMTPDGRSPIHFTLGERSMCNHAFIGGMTRTGKTTLLNNLIVQIAENYTSDQIRLYLMDYKDGVEFQAFRDHPNCEKIHLDNTDLNAATEFLDEFVQTIAERGRLFRAQDVNNIGRYNALNPDKPIPRLILIIDEVHRLLEDGPTRNRFNKQLIHVVKQGGSFGVHIILSTQTLSGYSLDNELMSQVRLRLAFGLSLERDCDRIFTYGNKEALSLKRYQFILNRDGGAKAGNVLGRSNPPPDIAARIAARLQALPAALVRHPVIARSTANDAGDVPTPAPATPLPAWMSERKPGVTDSEVEKQKALVKKFSGQG